MLICPKTIAFKTSKDQVQDSVIITLQLFPYLRKPCLMMNEQLSDGKWFMISLSATGEMKQFDPPLLHFSSPLWISDNLIYNNLITPLHHFFFNARMRKLGWAGGLNSLLIRNEKPSCYVLGSGEGCANLLSLIHLRDFGGVVILVCSSIVNCLIAMKEPQKIHVSLLL